MTSTSPSTPSIQPADVTHTAEFWILTPDGRHIGITGAMLYAKSTPWAVTIDFINPSGEVVPWTFARQLLGDGRYGWQGLLDVQIGPQGRHQELVAFVLSSPEGRALVVTRRTKVDSFIAATNRVVQPGDEGEHLDLDGAIAALCGYPDRRPRSLPHQSTHAEPRLGHIYYGGHYAYDNFPFNNQPGRHRREP